MNHYIQDIRVLFLLYKVCIILQFSILVGSELIKEAEHYSSFRGQKGGRTRYSLNCHTIKTEVVWFVGRFQDSDSD